MEAGPEGDEMGLFLEERSDLDEPMNTIDDEFDIVEEELVEVVGTNNVTATCSNVAYYDPPSHFTTVGMEGFYTTEFSECPYLENFNERNKGELYVGMVFKSKKLAEATIKHYNIRNSVTSIVRKSEADKYIVECPTSTTDVTRGFEYHISRG
ncbi:hypothetical protein GQ457_03G022600 [Hibiscus cannabinus]